MQIAVPRPIIGKNVIMFRVIVRLVAPISGTHRPLEKPRKSSLSGFSVDKRPLIVVNN
jgi:hypothetical protein